MKTFCKLFENIFAFVMFVTILLGIILILVQFFGVLTMNGNLMVSARNTIQKVAVVAAGISCLLSFIYLYIGKKKKAADSDEEK
ncbi:MAG: hypothetical protein LBT33_06915 [Spirochaetia bacterium]|nr:hypothetical protein [Spirochaetia bacterium]